MNSKVSKKEKKLGIGFSLASWEGLVVGLGLLLGLGLWLLIVFSVGINLGLG
jgi:hypothetical protein